MSDEERKALVDDLAKTEEVVARLRAENAELAAQYKLEPSNGSREGMRRAAASLADARERVDAAQAALAVFDKTGTRHGLIADEGRVVGTIALVLKPGTTQAARETAIEELLGPDLQAAADELGVVLAAQPLSFTRERPGRDAEGRTVLEVIGRVEGDRLLPAVSKSAKNLRR